MLCIEHFAAKGKRDGDLTFGRKQKSESKKQALHGCLVGTTGLKELGGWFGCCWSTYVKQNRAPTVGSGFSSAAFNFALPIDAIARNACAATDTHPEFYLPEGPLL